MSKTSKIIYLFLTDYILNNGYMLAENPVFDLIYIKNQGAAFNIFDGCRWFLIIFSVAAAVGLMIYAVKKIEKFSVFLLFFTSMLVSGIFTNMFERLIYGYVRDYIKLNFINFPVFNISDIFINIGVFSIILIILKRSYFNKKSD